MVLFSVILHPTIAAKLSTSTLAAVQNNHARRGHAVQRTVPLISKERAVPVREVVVRSAATIRPKGYFPSLSARMQRPACAAHLEKPTRRAYAVLLEMSTARGSAVGVLVQVADAR